MAQKRPRDPFKFEKRERQHPTLMEALAKNLKRPYIGVTQGGSSRKFPGAKSAATQTRFDNANAGAYYDGTDD